MSVTGTQDQMAKAGISIADIAAGVTAYHSHPGRAPPSRHDRAGRPHRGLDAGSHGRVDGLSHVFRLRWRRAAAAQRRRPRHHLPLRPLRHGRRRASSSACRTIANGRPSPRPCSSAPTLPPTRASRAMPAAPTIATCWSRSSSGVLSALSTEEAIARLEQRRHRHGARQRHGRAVGASAAQGARSLATSSARRSGPFPA